MIMRNHCKQADLLQLDKYHILHGLKNSVRKTAKSHSPLCKDVIPLYSQHAQKC